TADSYSQVVGLADFLQAESRTFVDFSETHFEAGVQPDLTNIDLLIIGSMLTNDPQKKATYLNSAALLRNFVQQGGTVAVLAQADQDQNSESWMEAPRHLTRV